MLNNLASRPFRIGLTVAGASILMFGLLGVAIVGGDDEAQASTTCATATVPTVNATAGAGGGTAPATAPAAGDRPLPTALATLGLSGAQLSNAQDVVDVALSRGLGPKGAFIGVMTAYTESTLNNVGHGDAPGPSSRGLFQQMPPWVPAPYRADPAANEAYRMDPQRSAGLFFDRMVGVEGWQTQPEWFVAQDVQGSEFKAGYTGLGSDGTKGWNYLSNYDVATEITNALLANQGVDLFVPGVTTGSESTTAPQDCVSTAAATAGADPTAVASYAVGQTVQVQNPGNPKVFHVAIPTGVNGTAVSAALTRIGVNYSWGGGGFANTPPNYGGPTAGLCGSGDRGDGDCRVIGFDCSGLTEWAWGMALHRSIGDYTGSQITQNPEATGARAPGDLIFWDAGDLHHVAMYLGRDAVSGVELIIEAPYSGAKVRVRPLADTKTTYAGWRRPTSEG